MILAKKGEVIDEAYASGQFYLDDFQDTSITNLLGEMYPKQNSTLGNFSFIDNMQSNFDFAVINEEGYKKQKQEMLDKLEKTEHINLYITKNDWWSYRQGYQGGDGLKAAYIHPDKMSKDDFNLAVNCLKQVKNDKATLINDKQPQNIRDYFNLNRVLVYGKPIIPKDTNLFGGGDLNRTFLVELSCQNPNYSLFIKPNGVVKMANKEFQKETPINIGYFNKNVNFIRETKIENSIVLPNPNDGKAITQSDWDKTDSSNDSFPVELRVNRSLRLVFNKKGEPINDYLQTCKTESGKTIYNLFKTETK